MKKRNITLSLISIVLMVLVMGCKPEVLEQQPVTQEPELEVEPTIVELVSEPEPSEQESKTEAGLPTGQPQTQPVKEFTIEADDYGIYPDKVMVNKGDKVIITFIARKDEVYFGGLDFKGEGWENTGKVQAGGSKTVEFTAEKTFEFKTYWPSSGAVKAKGQVIVE